MDTKAIAEAVKLGQPVVNTACELIKSLLGEPAKVAGGMLADQLYVWKWRNRMNACAKAAEWLRKMRVPARAMPAGFLLPVLEAVGNVDDESLQDLWARLIASAVVNPANQHPLLIDVLRRWSPAEARLFDRICQESELAFESPGDTAAFLARGPQLHQLFEGGENQWRPAFDEQALIPTIAMLEATGVLRFMGTSSNGANTVPIHDVTMLGRRLFWALNPDRTIPG
jgi:hypothetical protein